MLAGNASGLSCGAPFPHDLQLPGCAAKNRDAAAQDHLSHCHLAADETDAV